jgi:hypothetical protein
MNTGPLLSWELQTTFVGNCVVIKSPQQREERCSERKKQYNHQAERVSSSKERLLKALNIANIPFRVAIKKCNSGVSSRDDRSNSAP